MQTPKLLWLTEHRPEIYTSTWQFLRYTDVPPWRVTTDLAENHSARTGTSVVDAGTPLGQGPALEAAQDVGHGA